MDVLGEYDPTPYVRVTQTPESEITEDSVSEQDVDSVKETLQGSDIATLSSQGVATAEEPKQAEVTVKEIAGPFTSQSQQVDNGNSSSGDNDHEEVKTPPREPLLTMMDDMRASSEDNATFLDANHVKVGVFLGITTTLTAGVVTWVLKSGALLASMMGAIPILGRFDLLPILKVRDEEKEVESDDDTDLTNPDEKNRERVENMFSDHHSGQQRSEI